MDILESDKLKFAILKVLEKNLDGLSLNSLKKKCGAFNYRSVQRNCDFLIVAKLITVENVMSVNRKDKSVNLNYRLVKITPEGRKVVGELNNKHFDFIN